MDAITDTGISGSDFIFNEVNDGIIGTSARRLVPDGRSQDTFPLSVVLCLSRISATGMGVTAGGNVTREMLEQELAMMTERFTAVLYASTLEMSAVFSAVDPQEGDCAMIDTDRSRPETTLTSWMADSLGATKERLFITAGFTLDTRRPKSLMTLLGRLDPVILPGYIKYFRLYRMTTAGANLIGNDGEMFSSYCRETCAGDPARRTPVSEDDSRYRNLLKIFRRTYCTTDDIRDSVQQAFDESYSELIAEYVIGARKSFLPSGAIDSQELAVKLFARLKDII